MKTIVRALRWTAEHSFGIAFYLGVLAFLIYVGRCLVELNHWVSRVNALLDRFP